MANKLSKVVLTTVIRNPPSDIFLFKKVLEGGDGDLAIALIGGQRKLTVTLTEGHPMAKLKVGESVTLTGDENGKPIKEPIPLQFTQAHEPWILTGVFGEAG